MSKTFRALYRGESTSDSKQLAAKLEAARDVRVCAWRYVFDCYAKKRAECASSGVIPPGSLAIRAYEKRKAAETRADEVEAAAERNDIEGIVSEEGP